MATTRQVNYRKLIEAGFLPFEARELTRVTRITPTGKRIRVKTMPLNIPYIKNMITERKNALEFARQKKMSQVQYRLSIVEMYQDHNWLDDNERPDPWTMLREMADRYKDKHPDYESPGEKRKRLRKDYSKKLEGLQSYAKGRGRE